MAFSPFIADATAMAYKGATGEVQNKLRRVVEVWRQREIFELPIQQSIETRIDEIDKTRTNKRGLGGGSIFSASTDTVPNELVSLVSAQHELSRNVSSVKASENNANQDFMKMTAADAVIPSPPVYAARLNGLLKTLSNAEAAVTESIKARKVVIQRLESLLDSNRSTIMAEETSKELLTDRKTMIDSKKKEVEDSIMRGLPNSNPGTPIGADGSPAPGSNRSPATPAPEPIAPEVEALTPPRPEVEALTPPHQALLNAGDDNQSNGHTSATRQESPTTAVSEALLALSNSHPRPSTSPSFPAPKKRRMDDDFPDLGDDAMDGLDADVVASLQEESGNCA